MRSWASIFCEKASIYRKCPWRSEEHTSELQSPDHLVCRLLLEKKESEIRLVNPGHDVSEHAGCLFGKRQHVLGARLAQLMVAAAGHGSPVHEDGPLRPQRSVRP